MAPIEGGRPGTAVLTSAAALAGSTIGTGWIAFVLDRLASEVQVIALQMFGLVVVTAEVGLTVVVLQYLRVGKATLASSRGRDDTGPEEASSEAISAVQENQVRNSNQ